MNARVPDSGSPDDGSYEAVLAREDRRDRRIWLILVSITGPALTLYFDRWSVFLAILPMFVLVVTADIWQGLRLIRTGYTTRGRAQLLGAWETPALALVFCLFVLVQSYFGLWFAQHPIPHRYG